MNEGGLRFWETPNGVILCDGDADGYLPQQYFSVTIWLKDDLATKSDKKTAQLRLIESSTRERASCRSQSFTAASPDLSS